MDLTDLNVQLISETIFPINRLARINKKKEKKKKQEKHQSKRTTNQSMWAGAGAVNGAEQTRKSSERERGLKKYGGAGADRWAGVTERGVSG